MIKIKRSVALLLVLTISAVYGADKNNVCKNWRNYWTLQTNPDCTYNSDQNIEQLSDLVEKYNRTIQMFEVTTDDGYILQVFQVGSSTGKSVVIAHGVYMSAQGWFTTGEGSLPYLLADKGYDVWVISFRGTRYGNKHTSLTIADKLYWNYNLHELGTQDLPAILEFIYGKNGNKKMIYLGFSMGSSAAFIYSSMFPDQSQVYLERAVTLAPVVYLNKIPSVLRYLQILWDPIKFFLDTFKVTNLFSRSNNTRTFAQYAFLQTPANMLFYKCVMGSIFGFDFSQYNPLTLPVTIVQNPDAISVIIIDHYKQILRSGDFKAYDYGLAGNIQHYGSPVIPTYRLADIKIPFNMIYGQNDAIASKQNAVKAFGELTVSGKCLFEIPYQWFNHQDFVSAKDKSSLLYDKLVTDWLEASC